VEVGQGVDQRLADGGALGRAQRLDHGPGAEDVALDLVHDVEGDAEVLLVLAPGRRGGHRDGRALQGAHDAVLPAHVVRALGHLAERGPAQDPPVRAVGDAVGEVRLASAHQRGREGAGRLDRRRGQEGGDGVDVQAVVRLERLLGGHA
jgi:hypothetical protein